MIPPDEYLTFSHKYVGSYHYKGSSEEYSNMYNNFLLNPSSNHHPEFFNNILTEIEASILNRGKFCIIFVSEHVGGSHWKLHKKSRNELMKYIEKNPIPLIEAWDVHFKRVERLLDKSYAVIGIEDIMVVPFDRTVMKSGNIFITQYGNITYNNLTVEDIIDILENLSIQKS